MRRIPVRPAARPPGCDTCADDFGAILGGGVLRASFRPVVDFDACEIFGYIAAVRGPPGLLRNSFDRLARTARHLGRLQEFSVAAAAAMVGDFFGRDGKGLLFVPLPEGAAESGGRDLADAIRTVAAARGASFERIVIVVPAVNSEPFAAIAAFAARLKAHGFALATRTLACAYEEGRIWSQVAPDFMLLDERTFDGLDLAALSDAGVTERLAAEFGKGRRLVADGIRGSNDFAVLRRLGIGYGAGDFLGRANPVPTRAVSAAAHKAIAAACACLNGAQPSSGGILERLLIEAAPVAPTASADEVFALFEANRDLRAVAVVSGGTPCGLIARYDMIDNMARPFRHELYGRKACTRFMDAQPLTVDIRVSLEELADIVVGTDPRHLISGFVITERGSYRGMGSVQDLVREVTAMQMEAAKYANPLTQLPGNVPINQHIDNLIAADETCCIAYCDLDHFKPFNDVYGYAKGDEVIQLTARTLAEVCAPERDFLGHIGGDDFVLVFRSEDWEARCHAALGRFGAEILGFFSHDDIERGGYLTENRKGEPEFYRLTSLSIGAVVALPGMFQNHLQVSKVAAEVKKCAKAIAGNSLYINRRTYQESQDRAERALANGERT